MSPWPVQNRRLARAVLSVAIAVTLPGELKGAPPQIFDTCNFENDTFGAGSAPLCDPFTECWTDRYTCTIHPRLGLFQGIWQATCDDCQVPSQLQRHTEVDPLDYSPSAAGSPIGRLERASIAPGGGSADGGSLSPALSDDGRFVVFDSAATNLVPGDTNGRRDVFVFDRQLQQTERVSVATGGAQGDRDSVAGAISADGRFVAFLSQATNLVPSDTNNVGDVFVRDRQAQTTDRVSVGPGGIQTTGYSFRWSGPMAGGSWPFSRDDAFGTSLYVDMVADNTETAISADGRLVAFVSDATNLVTGDTNGLPDVFVHDRATATTERVSLTNTGFQLMPTASGAQQSTRPRVSISSTGQFVAFETAYAAVPDDTNAQSDVYVRDRLAGTTTRVSVSSAAAQGNGFTGWPSISGDGRYVAFASDASTLVTGDTNGNRDVFRHDRQTGQTIRASTNTATGVRDRMLMPAISRDGRWVAFARPSNRQAYLFDAATGALKPISWTGPTSLPDAASLGPAVNADGTVVAFASQAANLAPGDNNGADDIFITSNNLIFNGTFATDAEYWQMFAIPAGGITWEWSAGTVRFYRTGAQAVLIQPTGATVPAGVPLEARFDVANTSPSRRRFSVLIHDNDFTDLSVCTFWLAPFASSATYRMRTHTTRAWTNGTLSIYAATVGSDGYYVIDNVSMGTSPEFSSERTDCLDPAVPIPPGGPDGANLLVNGDFSAGQPPWGVFGQIVSQVQGGVFEFYRPAGTPAGVVLQPTTQPIAAGEILRASFDLGNSTAVRKRVTVLLHDADFSDLSACTFWIPPGQALSPYVMRAYTTESWTNATLSVYAASIGTEQWTRLDNVTFRRSPATSIQGAECVEPVMPVAPAPSATATAFRSIRPSLPEPATPLDTHMSTDGSRYVTPSIGAAGPTRLRLSFESALANHAAPGHVQASLDGVTWITIAEVAASTELVPVNVMLDVPSGARVRFRFVSAAGDESSWRIVRVSVSR